MARSAFRLPQIPALEFRTRSGRDEPCRTSRRSRCVACLVLQDLAQGENERFGKHMALALGIVLGPHGTDFVVFDLLHYAFRRFFCSALLLPR